jgi:hypothetical protein
MALEVDDFMQLSPICIAVFLLMTSLFNGDLKALVWTTGLIVGMVGLIPLNHLFRPKSEAAACVSKPHIISLFTKYTNVSASTFIIMYTFTYLFLPMQSANDWNYLVIFGFSAMLIMDSVFKSYSLCMTKLQWVVGFIVGIMYGFMCFAVVQASGGSQLLYFNTVSSNDVYCTRPKKQQFKCYVYKNGEIVSAV